MFNDQCLIFNIKIMKNIFKTLILFILIVTLMSCNNSSKTSETDKKEVTTVSNAKIQVVYFHATKRCATCNAVEDNAKVLLEEKYKTQIADGTMSFQSLNLEEDANKALVEKYLVSYSTLMIINNYDTEPTSTDLTDMAFQYARNEPDKYKELLKTEIDKNLR